MAHLHLHPGRLHWLYQYRFALAISQAVTGVSEALRAEGPESAMGVRQEDAERVEGVEGWDWEGREVQHER